MFDGWRSLAQTAGSADAHRPDLMFVMERQHRARFKQRFAGPCRARRLFAWLSLTDTCSCNLNSSRCSSKKSANICATSGSVRPGPCCCFKPVVVVPMNCCSLRHWACR